MTTGRKDTIDSILHFIDTHLEQTLSLDEIAATFGYSKYHLNRRFQKETGITLHQYIQRQRLEKAAKALAETKKPILEIALDAQYHSQQAFSLAFKRLYLTTPKAYRRAAQVIHLSYLSMEGRAAA